MANGYTNIPDWMLEYDLDIYETLILAVIFGFSQDGESKFQGSISYLMRKSKCSRAKVIRSLQKLVEKGLVIKFDKTINGVHLCDYKVSLTDTGSISQILGGSISQIPQNIELENKDNTICNTKRGVFQKPTLEDVRNYCQERQNSVNAEAFINHYESNGWMVGKSHIKDWKAAVRTWEQRDKTQRPAFKSNPGTQQRDSVIQSYNRVRQNIFGYGNQVDEQ